jgi:RNA polymerase sigma factor (sigma-70 family)
MAASGYPRPDQGRQEAFATFYEEYMPKVYKYIGYRIASTQAAEDLTSAVFEKALVKFESYRQEKAAFSTWIFAIARNTVIDYFRLLKKEDSLDGEGMPDVPDRAALPAEAAEQSDEIRRLHYCVDKLSSPEKDIISLKFGAELSNRDIARHIRLSETNIGVIVFRTVRKLRDCFREWQHE